MADYWRRLSSRSAQPVVSCCHTDWMIRPATDSVRVAGRALDGEQEFARRCHEALVKAAEPYGLTKAVMSRREGGGTFGPFWVTASYRRRGGPESRTALIDCHVDARGAVVALTEHSHSP